MEYFIYSFIIQIVYALNLMHTNGFFHRDIHGKNICYKKTSIKTINIFNMKIPTFGYLFSIIDYKSVISNKFNLSEDEVKLITYRDLAREDLIKFICEGIFHFDPILHQIH
jgi:hypothetical protein